MIYLDAYFFESDKCLDIRLDETMSVSEMILQLTDYFEMLTDNVVVFSKRLRKPLIYDETFLRQGVMGGDTLIFVENDAEADI